MLKNPISLSLEKNTYDALLLMRQKRVDTVFVVDKDNKLLGQVGMFDILKYGKNVKDLDEVTKPVYSITSNTRIMNAISDVYNLDTKNLPVVDDKNRLIGLITRATIVDTIYTNLRDDSSDKQEETRDKDDNLEELMKEASHDSKQNLGNKGDSNG